MLFNSQAYALFLPLVFCLFWLVSRHEKSRVVLLLVASYVFYGAWDPRYLLLIVFSTLLDYFVALGLGRTSDPRRRKQLLFASLAGNFGLLCTFKYYDFFVREMAALLEGMGFHPDVDGLYLRVLLPVGISFYTFQTLSYTIDVYRGQLAPERSVLRFSLFVAFFAQLVAGPIVRASHFLPQIPRMPRLDGATLRAGLALIFWGLVKKALVADYLGATLVDPVFSKPFDYGGVGTLLGLYGYAFQVYGDFSGYSDVAIGSAWLFGFDLGPNFRSPYRACSLREFWTRWHISLSTWLRDYLYFPLGGSRGGEWKTARNLVITLFLSGLWHGVGTTYLMFGLGHGLVLVVERLVGLEFAPASAFTRWIRRVYVLHMCTALYVLFRAPSFALAGDIVESLFAPRGTATHPTLPLLVLAAMAVVHYPTFDFKAACKRRFSELPGLVQGAAYALLVGLLMNAADLQVPFIYFQF